MDSTPHGTPDLRERFRAEVDEEVMPGAVRRTMLVVFVLNTVFIPLDQYAFQAHSILFLSARLSLDAVLFTVYYKTSRTHPTGSALFAVLAIGAMLLTMVAADGGPSSDYTTGLVLLFCGIPVLLPLSSAQVFGLVSVLVGCLLSIPLFGDGVDSWRLFAINILFPVSGGFVAAASASLLDQMRFSAFMRRRELEAARDNLAELDKAKSRFSSNIHHELRTPLTLILAPLDSLRAGDLGDLTPKVNRTLNMMHANAQRLYRMINNLLDLSKVESGLLEVHRVPLDLDALVSRLILGAQPLAERKNVELTASHFDTLPEICADPEALEKIIVNLVGNALKFTTDGDCISVTGEPHKGGVLICVRDTGIGIPQSKIETIFDRFAQVDNSATRKHEGTGIGLSLARELAELHGGSLRAESEGEGRGTSMFVYLPEGEVDANDEQPLLSHDSEAAVGVGNSMGAIEADLRLEDTGPAREEAVETMTQAGGTRQFAAPAKSGYVATPAPADAPEILVAEDNPDMRTLLASVIGNEFRVRLACNGREALDMALEQRPDLVLSDVMMPEMSGIDLCRELKGRPEFQDLPVVLVTSKAEHEMKIEGLELGADDYVTKPFHPRELLARVRSLVRVRGLQRQLAGRNTALEQALHDLKQAEAQLVQSERLSAVGELAAEIAHEVNNPVNFALNASRALAAAVSDFSELSQAIGELDGQDSDRLSSQLERLTKIREEIDADHLLGTLDELTGIISEGLTRTHSLVADLRDFAASGKIDGQRRRVDVGQGIGLTLQLAKTTLSTAGARISCEIDPALPGVEADPGALNQVFLNLVKNAAEAFGEDGGEIRVCATAAGDCIRITFEDNGPGIPDEIVEKIFDPFFTTKEVGLGTGLGLAISRKIVASHGGNLTVESREQVGTTFTVTLPISAEDASAPHSVPLQT